MIRRISPGAPFAAALAFSTLAALAGFATFADEPAVAPASPARELVQALEDARGVVVGEVTLVSRLGAGAYVAELAVEQVVAGDVPESGLAVAWEERAPSRPARLARGDRVLLGLEPLLRTSAWRDRLADHRKSAPWTIASRGGAWLARPAANEVAMLAHFLALPPGARSGPDGVRHLLALAAHASPPLARAAGDRLQRTAARVDLPPAVVSLVATALERPETRGVPASMVNWIAAKTPVGLEGGVGALLASLADDSRPAVRAAVAGNVSEPERLAKLLADPEPTVREAAVVRLADVAPDSKALARALADPAPLVRAAAARGLARRGDAAIATLHRISLEEGSPTREAALASLRLIGTRKAAAAITAIAASHPDPGMRKLAEFALTGRIGQVHRAEP